MLKLNFDSELFTSALDRDGATERERRAVKCIYSSNPLPCLLKIIHTY